MYTVVQRVVRVDVQQILATGLFGIGRLKGQQHEIFDLNNKFVVPGPTSNILKNFCNRLHVC